MGDNTLSNEAAIHVLDQAARLLQTIVEAKEAIEAAQQADQVRVNLEKVSANLRTNIAALESEKAQLLAEIEDQKQQQDKDIASAAAKAQTDQAAAQAVADAALSAMQEKIKLLEAETVSLENERKQKLDSLNNQIGEAEDRLAKAQKDYMTLKNKFKD